MHGIMQHCASMTEQCSGQSVTVVVVAVVSVQLLWLHSKTPWHCPPLDTWSQNNGPGHTSNVNADTSNTRVSGYHWTRINEPHHNHGKHYPCSRCVSHVWQDLNRNRGDSTLRRCHLHLCFTLWNDCSYKDLFEPICPYFLCDTFSYNGTFHLKYCQT